jgi:hypothetical protein
MTAPDIRQFVGSIPDKGQSQTVFDTNMDAFLDWQALQFAPDLVAFGEFASDTGAALVAANLPPLTGRAANMVRVNAAADGVEFRTPAQVLADIGAATAAQGALADSALQSVASLTQVQAENPASTVFGTVSGQRLAQAVAVKYGTLAVTTSGTAFDFTGIPADVSEVTLTLNCVSLSGTDRLLVQIGSVGGIVTTGYDSAGGSFATGSGLSTSTSGFIIRTESATSEASGILTLKRQDVGSNSWVSSHAMCTTVSNNALVGAGVVTLVGELTQLRLTRNGSNTFNNGTANISWRL